MNRHWKYLSRTWPRVDRSFSSVDTPGADVAASQVGYFAKQQPPRPIFPWRHEQSVLPRLIPNTEEYLMARPYLCFEDLLAYIHLGVPFLDVTFYKKQWRKDLSENMTLAFMQGLSAIMSNTFQIPINDAGESVEFVYEPRKSTTDDVKNSEEGTRFDNVQYNQMIATPLQKLFQSAHESGRDQLRIILETKPIHNQFLRLYGVPCLSRDDFERDAVFLRDIFNPDAPPKDRNPTRMYDEITKRFPEKFQKNKMLNGTVAAEVLIVCEEKFQVADAETGVVLQGSEGIPVTQEVGHVVTFEMEAHTLARKEEFPEARNLLGALPGNWQMTDIDDLVSVRKWYHM